MQRGSIWNLKIKSNKQLSEFSQNLLFDLKALGYLRWSWTHSKCFRKT